MDKTKQEETKNDTCIRQANISLSTDSIFNMNEEEASYLEGLDQENGAVSTNKKS